ncbi:MAG TPA: hypothetical protein VK157_02305 [Phycisphaerales bacterium]|nr:hypothetical protein [Phycisphaerales bacterium]
MRGMFVALSVGVGVARLTADAAGQCPPTVVYTNYFALSSSILPDITPATRFVSGASLGIAFQQIVVSPNGEYWALRGAAGTTTSHVIIRGNARTRVGARLVVRRAATQVLGTRTCDTVNENIDINDAGTVVFVGDLSGAFNDDGFSATWNNGFTFFAREGLPAPGLTYGFGTVNTNPGIFTNGQIRHVSNAFTGSGGVSGLITLSSSTSGSVLALTGTTVPTGQLATPVQPLGSSAFQRAVYSADGADTLLEAVLAGPSTSDFVLMHNNHVLAQEGFVIAGSGIQTAFNSISPGPAPLQYSPAGGMALARVTLVDATDIVLRIDQGAVTGYLAKTGDETSPGSGEVYDDATAPDTFIACAINSLGDYIIVGETSVPDPLRNSVLVYRGQTTLLREGTEFDLNEDGVLNDNAYVAGFVRDGVAIADNGDIYVLVNVRGIAGNVTGNAVLTLRAPTCSSIDFNNNGVFPEDQDVIDFFDVLAGATCATCSSIDFNNDCVFPSDDDVIAYFRVLAGGTCAP